jgi:hypothetical protein
VVRVFVYYFNNVWKNLTALFSDELSHIVVSQSVKDVFIRHMLYILSHRSESSSTATRYDCHRMGPGPVSTEMTTDEIAEPVQSA